jgi:ubiquinone/menaquinone biosynthesis C-methylase UbiE
MRIRERLMLQFGMPEGILGRIAGFIMAHRSSNIERIKWAIAELDARAADCVLEIGFGPGIGIRLLSDRIIEGKVYGIDHSPLMARKAKSRNKIAVDSGRVELIVTSSSQLPSFDRRIDKALDINTFQFWDEPMRALRQLRAALKPGGIIAIVHEPRERGATDRDTIEAGRRISETLEASGFEEVRQKLRRMKPVSTVCVIGKNPA